VPFSRDADCYPHRDEVVAYLLRYADRLDADIRTGTLELPPRGRQ
jgi:putative flavoprotein involved in K+ transport